MFPLLVVVMLLTNIINNFVLFIIGTLRDFFFIKYSCSEDTRKFMKKFINKFNYNFLKQNYNLASSKNGYQFEYVTRLLFFRGWIPMLFYFSKKKQVGLKYSNLNTKHQLLNIYTFRFLQNKLMDLIFELEKVQVYTEGQILIQIINHYQIQSIQHIPTRDPNTIYNIGMKNLINYFNNPKKKQLENKDKNVILIHGPPGTGKSSAIRAIASHLNKDIIFTDLKNQNMDEFMSYIKYIENTDILVSEDIDNWFDDDYKLVESNKLKERIVLDDMLKIFDGDFFSDGIIWICTANDIDKLPKKLIRDGRINFIVEFKMPSITDINDICNKMNYTYTDDEFISCINCILYK